MKNIKQYQGRTEEEAIEEARRELGNDMVIMRVKKKRSIFGSAYFVTAGVEDDVPLPDYKEAYKTAERSMPSPPSTGFDAVADESMQIPYITTGKSDAAKAAEQAIREKNANIEVSQNKSENLKLSEDDIRSTFRAVEEVISQTNEEPTYSSYDKRATLVHYNDPADSTEYTREAPKGRTHRRQYTPPKNQMLIETDDFSTDGSSFLESEEQERPAEVGSRIVRAIYSMLLRSEVDERYINQIMAELDINILNEVSIETALGFVYQKLVLKFGRPKLITTGEKKPKVVFFIGPTGVGKTTTIAKLASDFRFNQKKKVALFTADTYRIAAEKQISVYGELMNIDVVVLYVEDKDDINEKIAERYSRYDLILVDTTGFSHHDEEQIKSITSLLDSLSDRYEKQVYLVLSATTKYRDLKRIVDVYRGFTDFDLLFTKLDETEVYGNLLNIKLYAEAPLSYVTNGQTVPDDFEVIDSQKMVHSLLGGGM